MPQVIKEVAPKDLETVAGEIWDLVCHNIDQVLKECELYGLAGILIVPDPSVEARITALKVFEVVCTSIVSALESSADSYSTIRIMLNAKQQLVWLEQLLNAAKNADSEGFKKAEDCLKNQARH